MVATGFTARISADAAKFLTESGAKRIRGDEAHRQKASLDRVREEGERLNPDPKRLHKKTRKSSS
jgi:hypothetical protein